MAKEVVFHADLHPIEVVIEGLSVSMLSEVDITIRQPAKLDPVSRRAWAELAKSDAQAATVRLVPKATKV